MSARPAEHYVHGTSLIMPARVAAMLERQGGLGDFRLKVRGRDPELDQVLIALHVVAARWAAAGSAPATDRVASSQPRTDSDSMVTPSAAASRLGVTPAAIRKAIRGRRLAAVKGTDGRWSIAAADLKAYGERQER